MSDWLAPDVIASAPGRVNLIGEIEDAIKVAFASTGFHAPRFFTSLPSDGARIEPLA